MSPSDPGDVVRVDVALVEDPIHVSVTAYQGIPGPPGPPGVDGVDGVDGAPGPPGPSGAVAHAPTHNTGGTDPITALSAAVLTTGTIPNARLAADVLIAGSVAVGTNPAQSGAVRLANNQAITARNAANTADMPILQTVNGNNLSLQCDAAVFLDSFYSSGLYRFGFDYQGAYPARDNQQDLGLDGFRFRTLALGKSINLKETTAPAAPLTDQANLWLQDNGAGKSQLMIQFATGAPIAIATQV